jgi:hypothetical protein
MTIGTAIVISISILCVTFLLACCLGASINKKKTSDQLTQVITEQLTNKLKETLSKK